MKHTKSIALSGVVVIILSLTGSLLRGEAPPSQRETDLWNLFSGQYVTNCLSWTHAPANPLLPLSRGGRTERENLSVLPDLQE